MPDSIVLLWRDSPAPSDLSDVEILRRIEANGMMSIYQISEDRTSKSRLRLQCQYLQEMGMLTNRGNEVYSVTNKAGEFLEGDRSMPESEGYFDLQELLYLSDNRITDLSLTNQEDIKQINLGEYTDAINPEVEIEQEYSVNIRDSRRKVREILSAKKWKLDRILREFPVMEPITSQCAHWVTSLASLHLFPDANHRTAMISLYQLALANGVIDEEHRWPGDETEIGKAVLLSKFHRYLSPSLNFERLWRRNTLYWHWYQYFEHLLFDVEYPALNYHSEVELRKKLNRVRRR